VAHPHGHAPRGLEHGGAREERHPDAQEEARCGARGAGLPGGEDITLQYSTVQDITVQYSAVQYSAVQYSTVQYSTVQACTRGAAGLVVQACQEDP